MLIYVPKDMDKNAMAELELIQVSINGRMKS